jgi:cell wall-associated NlpC family hydrolase
MDQLVSSNILKMWSAIEYGKSFIGQKYVWGANDTSGGGFDCSGLFQELAKSVGLWPHGDCSAQQIFTTLIQSTTIHGDAQKGDALFFGESRMKITHVAIAINDWQMLEAGGGGQNTKTGMVRIRPISNRKDLVAILRFK